MLSPHGLLPFELAAGCGIALGGFARSGRVNLYAGAERDGADAPDGNPGASP